MNNKNNDIYMCVEIDMRGKNNTKTTFNKVLVTLLQYK